MSVSEERQDEQVSNVMSDVVNTMSDAMATYESLTGSYGGQMGIANFVKGGGVSNMARAAVSEDIATLREPSRRSKMMAEFVEASNQYHSKGLSSAKEFLKKSYPNWTIDPKLSNDSALVISRNGTNDAIVAFRGTDPSAKITSGLGKGMPEPVSWLAVSAGQERRFKYFQESESAVRNAMKKYTITELGGFSRGGATAIDIGNRLGIPTETFNPFLGKNAYSKARSPVNHNILRTTDDVASSSLSVFKPKMKFNIDTIDTKKSLAREAKSIITRGAPRNEYLTLMGLIEGTVLIILEGKKKLESTFPNYSVRGLLWHINVLNTLLKLKLLWRILKVVLHLKTLYQKWKMRVIRIPLKGVVMLLSWLKWLLHKRMECHLQNSFTTSIRGVVAPVVTQK